MKVKKISKTLLPKKGKSIADNWESKKRSKKTFCNKSKITRTKLNWKICSWKMCNLCRILFKILMINLTSWLKKHLKKLTIFIRLSQSIKRIFIAMEKYINHKIRRVSRKDIMRRTPTMKFRGLLQRSKMAVRPKEKIWTSQSLEFVKIKRLSTAKSMLKKNFWKIKISRLNMIEMRKSIWRRLGLRLIWIPTQSILINKTRSTKKKICLRSKVIKNQWSTNSIWLILEPMLWAKQRKITRDSRKKISSTKSLNKTFSKSFNAKFKKKWRVWPRSSKT